MPAKVCTHINLIKEFPNVNSTQCKECVAMGDSWVFLRQCRICGNVGCCDNSKNKHATDHFKKTGHPIIKNLSGEEDGGEWSYCYVDDVYFK